MAYAIKLFDVLLQKYPTSPRSLYGKAHALDLYADRKKSNDLLQQSINYYLQTLELTYTPEHLFQLAAERCINRLRFIGKFKIYRQRLIGQIYRKLQTRHRCPQKTNYPISKRTEASKSTGRYLFDYESVSFLYCQLSIAHHARAFCASIVELVNQMT